MEAQGRIRTLYTDESQQEAIFPTTKTNAITDKDGSNLDVILSQVIYQGPNGGALKSIPTDAESLGGVPAADYFTKIQAQQAMQFSHLNLLDNSNFKQPVNQREFSSTNDGQTSNKIIDRWEIHGDDYRISIQSNGLYIFSEENVYLSQKFEKNVLDKNVKYTLAYLTNNGLVIENKPDLTFQGSNSWDELRIHLPDYTEQTIFWAALYEGEYDYNSLPKYTPKGYAYELLRCQRYFIRYQVTNSNIAFNYADGTYGILIFQLPTEMRMLPSVEFAEVLFIDLDAGGTIEMSGEAYVNNSTTSNIIVLTVAFKTAVGLPIIESYDFGFSAEL